MAQSLAFIHRLPTEVMDLIFEDVLTAGVRREWRDFIILRRDLAMVSLSWNAQIYGTRRWWKEIYATGVTRPAFLQFCIDIGHKQNWPLHLVVDGREPASGWRDWYMGVPGFAKHLYQLLLNDFHRVEVLEVTVIETPHLHCINSRLMRLPGASLRDIKMRGGENAMSEANLDGLDAEAWATVSRMTLIRTSLAWVLPTVYANLTTLHVGNTSHLLRLHMHELVDALRHATGLKHLRLDAIIWSEPIATPIEPVDLPVTTHLHFSDSEARSSHILRYLRTPRLQTLCIVVERDMTLDAILPDCRPFLQTVINFGVSAWWYHLRPGTSSQFWLALTSVIQLDLCRLSSEAWDELRELIERGRVFWHDLQYLRTRYWDEDAARSFLGGKPQLRLVSMGSNNDWDRTWVDRWIEEGRVCTTIWDEGEETEGWTTGWHRNRFGMYGL